MKRLTFPVLILLITFSACAQNNHLDKFYQKYADNVKNDDNIAIDPNLLLTASFGGKGKADGNWMSRITYVRCMVVDVKKTPHAEQEWSDLSASLRADQFEEWFSLRQGHGRVELLSRDGNQTDIACLLVGDDGGGLFFHLRGHFTAQDKARIEQALQNHDGE